MLDVAIVAVEETAGSALYGMVDVLSATGSIWQTLVRTEGAGQAFRVKVVSPHEQPFRCGYGVPVQPDVSIADDPPADIVIAPELWLGPDEDIKGRYPELLDWITRRHAEGAWLYSACSGAIMLAATGLLDGRDATSHWGYQDLFRKNYPNVRFRPEPPLAFADPTGRIVTAGGTSSWHDLALHIIARHVSPAEALRIAKVYLMKLHGEGQLPYQALIRGSSSADALVEAAEEYLKDHLRDARAVMDAVSHVGIPERTLKRRFKAATGSSLIEYLQRLRIEEAKRVLEWESTPVEEVSLQVGYEDASFFRRLFKRLVGLTPSEYRRMFQPVAHAGRGAARTDVSSEPRTASRW